MLKNLSGNAFQYSEICFKLLKHSECLHLLFTGSQRKCSFHLYQCGSGECVDPSMVCNRFTNCADSSDEGAGCAQRNCSSLSAPQCDHHCVSTPNGPVSAEQTCIWLFFQRCPKLNLSRLSWNFKQATIGKNSRLGFQELFHQPPTARALYLETCTQHFVSICKCINVCLFYYSYKCAPSSFLLGLKMPFFALFAEVLLWCRFQTTLQCFVLCGHWRVQCNATSRMQTHLPKHPWVLHLSLPPWLLPGAWQQKLQDQRYYRSRRSICLLKEKASGIQYLSLLFSFCAVRLVYVTHSGEDPKKLIGHVSISRRAFASGVGAVRAVTTGSP